MDIITESPEHQFLTFLEKLKADPSGWVAIRFVFSGRLDHDQLSAAPQKIRARVKQVQAESAEFLKAIAPDAAKLSKYVIYNFSDCDVLLLAHAPDNAEHEKLQQLYWKTGKMLQDLARDYTVLTNEIYNYQKLADRKLLSTALMRAYDTMADRHRIESMAVRRRRRAEPLVMVVEDDRFTASYASSLLNKEFDVVIARNGEEAIVTYIEHVPDILFLDIHLPGISGHQTLKSIGAVDPEVYAVMLSVDTASGSVKTATDMGAMGFLKKPFSRERLLTATRKSPFIKRFRRKTEDRTLY